MNRLLQREATPGKPSPVAKAKVQAQLQAGINAGQWRTARQVAAWLEEARGVTSATWAGCGTIPARLPC